MIPLDTWLLFALACVALAATPGPNQLYLVSRTLAQGLSQLAVVAAYDTLVIFAASSLSGFVGARPAWARASRRLLAGVFAVLAVRLLLDERR